jgi:hypothetical protein
MGSITDRLQIMFCVFFIALQFTISAQPPVYKNATAANRTKTYNNIVKNIITKNLALPLTDSTEENWQDAFYAIEVLQYKQPWVLQKIKAAFDSVNKRSIKFQRALLELAYTNYKNDFVSGTTSLLQKTGNAKVFAMCAEYIFQSNQREKYLKKIYATLSSNNKKYKTDAGSKAIITAFFEQIIEAENTQALSYKKLQLSLISQKYLYGNTIVYSIQRKNRNYPGIAIVRDSTGNFVKDSTGNIFSVPQLARSITNLPGYLTNGNTPQGIFRMNGFAVSKSAAIGPTENIQLLMPHETSPQYFLKDSNITDTVWTTALYERLLPEALKKYHPLFGTYYASACGRTEIIAHGTTVDPMYYKGQPYYPHTPTQGCLCTKEIWSSIDGKRTESNQQKLVDAVKKAGGANGYVIVIEIDDQQKPVSINELLPYIKN